MDIYIFFHKCSCFILKLKNTFKKRSQNISIEINSHDFINTQIKLQRKQNLIQKNRSQNECANCK